MDHLRFDKVPEPIEKRIDMSYKNQGYYIPNCHGTAMFLLGVLPYDIVVFTHDNEKNLRNVLSKMDESPSLIDNCLMVSSIILSNQREEIVHSSFIMNANPLKGFHRRGARGLFEEFESLSIPIGYVQGCSFVNGDRIINRFYSVGDNNLEDWAREIIGMYNKELSQQTL